MKRIETIEAADLLTVEEVRARIDAPAARAIDEDPRYYAPPNGATPHLFEPPPEGAWRLDFMGNADVLLRLPVDTFEPLEGDHAHALRHWTTRNYIKWIGQGIHPPPITVLRTDRGNLRSCNRRRWLAARAAGLPSLLAWYSPSHATRSGRSRWYLPEWNEAALQSYATWTARGVDPRRNLTEEEIHAIRLYAVPRLNAGQPAAPVA